MTAHSNISAAHGLTLAALNGEAILRAIVSIAPSPLTTSALSQASGRPIKNIGRDLSQLVAAGLLTEGHHLTPSGAAALEALDRAAGDGEGRELRVPVMGLKENPNNPRKRLDEDEIEAMADTLYTDQDVLQPLLVSPVDPADGLRFIWAGHRRWRAARRLVARGDMPPSLAAGLPCRERAADQADALYIAVVENSQRVDLTPWEDAQALAALAAAKNWTGRHLAKAIGRSPGDSDKGVRDVQEKIKVAQEAAPDLVAAHERGDITWEALRDSVRKKDAPAPIDQPQNVHHALFLVELALLAESQSEVWDAPVRLSPALQWPASWDPAWTDYEPVSGVIALTARATEWLARVGLGEDPELTLNYYRMGAGHPAAASGRPTPWASAILNPPAAPRDPAELEAALQAQRRTIERQNPVRPAPAPTEDREIVLTAADRLILIEVAHACAHSPDRFTPAGDEDLPYVPAGKYWLDQGASRLQQDRLIDFKHAGRPFIRITAAGAAWLAAQGVALPVADAALFDEQAMLEQCIAWRLYATSWLTPEPLTPADADAEPAQYSDAGLACETVDALDETLAGEALADANGLAPGAPGVLRALLARTGIVLPLRPGNPGCVVDAEGAEAFVTDVQGHLHDDMAKARVIALIDAVHQACGVSINSDGGAA